MNLKSNVLIFIMIFSLLSLGCGAGSKTIVHEELWKQVPLRSSAQKEVGLMGGEGMQRIFKIAYAPSNPEVVYLVSNTSQVWKSIDGGNSWKMMHKGFLSNGGIDILVDPVNENIVFVAGAHGRKSYSSPADGIYRTTDGGEAWWLVKQTPIFGETIEGKHFVFVPKSGDGSRTKVIYAGTHQDGLLISKDGGDNWGILGFKGERILDIRLNPINPSILYLLTIKGLFKVTIKDYVISQTEKLGKDLQGTFKTFALNPKNPLIIYIARGKAGVYKSTDGGKNFFKLKKGLPAGLDYTQIAISPINPEYLYVSIHRSAKLNPFWSHDGGGNWHSPTTLDKGGLSLMGGRYASASIEPHPKEPNIALTAANGRARVLKTDDGGISWFDSGNGYTGGRKGVGKTSHAFYLDPKKMIFFLIDFGPALTEDGGDTFKMLPVPRVEGKSTPVGAVEPTTEGMVIVTAIGGWERQTLAISQDNGENWEIIPGTGDNFKFIAFHSQKTNIIYAQGVISRDSGNSWEKLSQKIYAIFRVNGNIVYSIDDFGKNKSVIKRSNDQGKTWTTPYPYLPIPMKSINEIDVDPLNPDRIYVASNRGLYIYDDKNRKWQKKGEESGLSKDRFGFMSFKCVAVDPKHLEVIYTGRWAPGKGQSNGIFRSVDYGKTWENITYNLGPEFNVWSISVSPHDGTVYIGSSHGTWKLPPPY